GKKSYEKKLPEQLDNFCRFCNRRRKARLFDQRTRDDYAVFLRKSFDGDFRSDGRKKAGNRERKLRCFKKPRAAQRRGEKLYYKRRIFPGAAVLPRAKRDRKGN